VRYEVEMQQRAKIAFPEAFQGQSSASTGMGHSGMRRFVRALRIGADSTLKRGLILAGVVPSPGQVCRLRQSRRRKATGHRCHPVGMFRQALPLAHIARQVTMGVGCHANTVTSDALRTPNKAISEDLHQGLSPPASSTPNIEADLSLRRRLSAHGGQLCGCEELDSQ
jgi:hypothetical protein